MKSRLIQESNLSVSCSVAPFIQRLKFPDMNTLHAISIFKRGWHLHIFHITVFFIISYFLALSSIATTEFLDRRIADSIA
jgi:hypothetical protein